MWLSSLWLSSLRLSVYEITNKIFYPIAYFPTKLTPNRSS
ncbi:hypothetical protein HPHPH21_0706 [Helicobacter pylori Hp H-21]|nr:hypothetical protein HPHPH21_0706 [Helicobacter pylori Hp H-21]